MLRKKLHVFFNSYKSSAKHKPMALVILFIAVAVAIISCGWGTRMISAGIESELYYGLKTYITNDFKYDEAGKLVSNLRDEGLFGVDSSASIDLKLNGVAVEANGNVFSDQNISAWICYYGNEYINEKHIANHEQVIGVSEFFASEFGVSEGDEIKFNGEKFTVNSVMQHQGESLNVYLPYTADFNQNEIVYTETKIKNIVTCNYSYLNFSGLERLMTSGEKNALEEVGIIAEHYPPVSAAWVWVWIMLILMVVINIINIVVVAKYWLRVNDRKYAVMKITGAPPETIAGAMTLEALGTTLVGAGLGLVIEYFIATYVLGVSLNKLLWLHYALLLPIVLSAVIVPLVVKVIKRARSTALDRRMYL